MICLLDKCPISPLEYAQWLNAPANRYTVDSQEYDAIVRDADPAAPGNQEYTVVFAAGNAYGGGTILTPASAKNVITVGASENYRPEGVVDGCGVGDEGADSADDVVDFSSGGPLDEIGHCVQNRMMFDRRRDKVAAALCCRCEPHAANRQVIAFGSARGENDLGGLTIQYMGNGPASVFQGGSRTTA